MSEVKHTPGPWTVGRISANGQEVAVDTISREERLGYSSWDELATAVAYGCDDNPEVGAQVALANARLIAVAPDLLEVARRWSALDGNAWNVARHARDKEELMADTLAAITRATEGSK